MSQPTSSISVRSLTQRDLDEADAICRSAFDTFLGIQDLFGDKDYVHTRWQAAPHLAIAADVDGRLAGSNFVTHWGSFAFFGPVSVRPELWDQGVAKALMEATMDRIEASGARQAGLFTFPQSPKHLGLYERFGFWPQALTPVFVQPVVEEVTRKAEASWLNTLGEAEQARAIAECRQLCDELYPGLDLGPEIQAVRSQGLGEVVLLAGDRLIGFAVCHLGAETEAGSGSCYVKFGALRPGADDRDFDRLVDACALLARARGASRLELGVNAARERACRRVQERGFRAGLIGVAMQRPNKPGWNREDLYVIDDWR